MQSIVTLTMNPSLDIASETDRLEPESKLRCAAPQYDAGGGGINVARAIRQLGGDPLAVFPCGGPSGTTIAGLLKKEGVRYQAITIDGPTRENFHILERSTGRQYRFVIEGPTISAFEQEHCLAILGALHPTPDFLVASGSLPPGASEGFYAEVAHIAKNRGIQLVLDTTGASLRKAAKGALLIKPSLQELEEMLGRQLGDREAQEKAVDDLVATGAARIVLLSLGAKGALLATAAGHWRLPPVDVPVRSTVGAGDSMVAATVLRLAQGWSVLEAVKYGIAAASAAVLHSGTQLCRRDDVDRFYQAYSLNASHPDCPARSDVDAVEDGQAADAA